MLQTFLWALGSLSILGFPASVATNHPPRFANQDGNSEIVLRLLEGPSTPVGSLLLQLRGEDIDGDNLEFGVREPIGQELLLIKSTGPNSADVFLRQELDRETREEYALVLTLTDGHLGTGHFVTRSLFLLVEDINDNEPVFKHYQSTIRIREDSAPGILTTVEATDADKGPYGQVIYSLEELDGDNHLFSVTPHNGKGVIRLVGKLDYERKYLYQVRVLAKDRANKGRVNTATAAILIKVEDVEDQPPEFVIAPSVTRIAEDVPQGSPVLQVKAVDGDRGINNRITYKITNGSFGSFDIDPNTGIVSTRGSLDRESPLNNGGAYTLEIMATEESRAVKPPPWISTQITVLVTDVNDEKPTFRSAAYVGEVNENAPVSTPVAFLADTLAEVFDHDQGDNGTFQMFLDGDRGIFEVTPSKGINEATFLIRVKDPLRLDFEQVTSLNFTLIAKEIVPNNPKYSMVPVTVYIRDMNDNFPEFSLPFYEVSVKENSGIGTTIARIQATDSDSGYFGTAGIRYTHIGGSIANFLILDPESGLVTIGQDGPTFDRELVASHYLTVEARDQLGRGNRNSVQLIINIEDLNDNAPLFVQSKYEARLLENSIEFDSPLVMEARDMDLNGTANSQIQYKIVSGDPGGNFTIDLIHGVLEPRMPLDFEQLPKDDSSNPRLIQLVVRAFDLGVPSLFSDVAVRIYIHDINDHAPLFHHQEYHIAIPEDLQGGTSVLRVSAHDSDGSAPNNMIVYRIERGAQDKFVMEADTGVLRVAHGANLDPDRTNPRSTNYFLTILALDGGIGPDQLSAKVPVNITIVDVNNKPPIFRELTIVDVLENTQVGKNVYQVVADDPDEEAILRYKIDGSKSEARNEEGALVRSAEYDYVGAFELDAIDGRLQVVKILDREKVELIRLALEVEDKAATTGTQTATGTLTIRIGDENDNSPRFSKPLYRRSITENSKHGAIIGHVVAEDPDKNRTITYSLEGPQEVTDLVHLDHDTGEVVVASRIDHEQFAWLNATVKATDSGIPSRSGYADLCIQVIDENDNNPYFILDINNITVREDAPIGSEIIQIKARDADSGDFGKITYLLDRMSSQGKFQINPETGLLNVSDRLNREEQNNYLLVIEAWDNYQYGYSSGESRNAFKQIGVNIVDVNDERPVLEPIYGCVTITEFHRMGELVTLIKATDADDPTTPNGRIFFSLVGGTGIDLFKVENVDFSTGRVITATSLKARYGNYTLLIRAQDQGVPPLSDNMELSICVTDFNDNAPRFVSPLPNATLTIPENATLGTLVVQVEAIDDDIGPNGAVRYRLQRDTAGHWKAFTVHELTGEVRLAEPLDRERQKTYQLRVVAYDLGIPTPLTSDIELTILVRNVNDHQPQFLTDEYHINFTEHALPGSERRHLLGTVDLDDRDELELPVPVCYFIVGGNDGENFDLDPLIHELTTIEALDREDVARHELIVKATENCNQTPEMIEEFDPNDDTLLKVVIEVLDINDNAPRFIKNIFTGGVTTDADFGSQFMQIKAIDLDSDENAQVSYYQVGPIRKTLTEGLEWLDKPPFVVDRQTGDISLNFDPQKGMKGYFDFKVLANDTGGLHDIAHVFIYLLREDQRVRFVLRQHPSEVRHRIDTFREILGNVTNAIVNIDDFKIHENKDGSVDKTKTDLYLHLVNYQNNSIMEVPDVLRLVDQNIELLDTLFKDFNVLDTQPAAITNVLTNPDEQLVMWLVGATIFLGLLLVACLAVCLAQRTRYQRQLKAATVTAFGSNESDLHRVAGQVPNTNMHSVEGSNPIWMQAYENEWYKHSDSLSQTSERDSLDENAVVNDNTSQNPSQVTKPTFGGQTCIYNSCNRSGILSVSDASNFKEQNDLNRNGMTYHQNLHQHLDKLSNPLITKKLETTEL